MKKQEKPNPLIDAAIKEANDMIMAKAAEHDKRPDEDPDIFRDAMIEMAHDYIMAVLEKYNLSVEDKAKIFVVPTEIMLRAERTTTILRARACMNKAFADVRRGDLQRDELYPRLYWNLQSLKQTSFVGEKERYYICELYAKGSSLNELARIFDRSTRTIQKTVQHAIADGLLEKGNTTDTLAAEVEAVG